MTIAAPSVAPEERLALPPEGSYLRRALSALFSQRSAWSAIALATLLEASFSVLGPWLASLAIDEALPNRATGQLALIASAVIAAAAYNAWAGWMHLRVTISLQYHLEQACSREVLRAILATPYAAARESDFGSVSQTVGAAGATSKTLVKVVVAALSHGTAAAGSLLLLLAWFPGLALFTLVASVLTTSTALVLSQGEARSAERALAAAARHEDLLHLLIGAAPAVRTSGAEKRLLARWTALLADHARAVVARDRARISRDVTVESGQRLLALCTTGWLVHAALAHTVTIGQLLTGMMVAGNFARVIADMTQIGLGLRAMRPHFERVERALGAARREARAASRAKPLATDADIVLQGVWFRYGPDSRWVLRDYGVSLPAGRLSRLSAASGSGKTTLLRLIAGLLPAERGTVSVLGRDPMQAQDLVVYLPQQSTLLEASIFANLRTLSRESLERVMETAALTGLDVLLERLPMGGETPVSLNGSNLSAGQRQLVLLTAAFASRRPVVLLDEPTSQLDAASKARIRWEELIAGRTVIVVEHA